MARLWEYTLHTKSGLIFHQCSSLKTLKATIRRLKSEGRGPTVTGFSNPMLPWLIEDMLGGTICSSRVRHAKLKIKLLNEEK